MRRLCRMVAALFLLTACSSNIDDTNTDGDHTVIDWVDFIKLNGKEYSGIQTGVMADPAYAGEELGEVAFMVAGNVTDPDYKTKDGDAAFWEKRTKVYAVKNAPSLLAVKDSHEINGYRLYYARTDKNMYKWHFKDLPRHEVREIAIYQRTDDGTYNLVKSIEDEKGIQPFFSLLDSGKEQPSFTPDTSDGDPSIFQLVFYTNEPVAYNYSLQFDGKTFFWHPWDTVVLPNEMKKYTEGTAE